MTEENGFGKLVAHAPYTMNPCSADPKVRAFARTCMEEDLEKLEFLPHQYYNFHPGSHVGQGTEKGIELIADFLNETLKADMTTTVLLETMAGKGSEVGSSFDEIAEIIARVDLKEKLGVCLDTCHVSDAGYDITDDPDGVFAEFDEKIGLDRLKALHINDSMNERGERKDRHARIGEGKIGLSAIKRVADHPVVVGLPCILETPQDDYLGYADEIALLRA